jgi:hypothetical protein
LNISLVMIEPESTDERIRQITNNIFLRNGDLGFGNRQGPCKKNSLDLPYPGTDGGGNDPVEVVVGNDLLIHRDLGTLNRVHDIILPTIDPLDNRVLIH